MERKKEKYYIKSQELAKCHLMERLCFELEVNKKFFNKSKCSIDELIVTSFNSELFNDNEYKDFLKKNINSLKNNSIIIKYDDIIKITKDNIENYNFFD